MIEKNFIVDDHVFINNKKYMLNFNIYQRSHYHELSDVKNTFMLIMHVNNIDFFKNRFKHVEVNYTIFPHNKTLFDTMNIITVIDKFFLDTLIFYKVIPDDNYTVVEYDKPPVVFNGISRENKNKKILICCKFFD